MSLCRFSEISVSTAGWGLISLCHGVFGSMMIVILPLLGWCPMGCMLLRSDLTNSPAVEIPEFG